MVRFGERIRETRAFPAAWASRCLAYDDLKSTIEAQASGGSRRRTRSGIAQSLSLDNIGSLRESSPAGLGEQRMAANARTRLRALGSPEIRDDMELAFAGRLDDELEGVVCFVLAEQGSLAEDLHRARADTRWGSEVKGDLDALADEYRAVGRRLVSLLNFLELNITGTRKILKKYNKVMHTRLASRYLLSRSGPWGLLNTLHHHGLYSLATVVATRLVDLQARCTGLDAHAALASKLARPRSDLSLVEAAGRRAEFVFSRLESGAMPSDVGLAGEALPLLASGIGEPVLGALVEARRRIEGARRRLSTDYLAITSRIDLEMSVYQAGCLGLEGDDDSPTSLRSSDGRDLLLPVAAGGPPRLMEGRRRHEDSGGVLCASHLLNFASTFLYMTNYYIIAPNSALYAERLGGDRSLGATVIGCTPLMASASALVYSWWTNRSYREPLVLCAALMAIGNGLYAVAEPFDSLAMIIVGRMVNGLGGARGINRRYIADATSDSDRQRASAIFVGAGALGLAFGPASNALLRMLPAFRLPVFPALVVDDFTAPGYFMALLWTVYLLLVLLFFKEPERRQKVSGVLRGRGGSRWGAFRRNSTPPEREMEPLVGGVAIGAAASSYDAAAGASTMIGRDDADPDGRCLAWVDPGILLCVLLFFCNKLTVEVIVSSFPSIAHDRFALPTLTTSCIMAAFGLLVLPANALLSYVTERRNADVRTAAQFGRRTLDGQVDAETWLIVRLGAAAGAAIFLVLEVPGIPLSVDRYVMAMLTAFVLMQAQEGVLLSKLSKLVSRTGAARTTCNSGLLATEAGTTGRVVGDVFITVAAAHAQDRSLSNAILGPILVFLAATVASARLGTRSLL